ncbi:hypothetical protein [Spirosoma agri]|uniref:Uncharacterized protein n=1 Tax=Spirosoma agri TaxID=1987381 RepID=A0A6M0IJL4_9BACT|nr:hypothetical protein [Spirosoma agri]NEU67815.1 hypothetical protein [Spirosoma agri]
MPAKAVNRPDYTQSLRLFFSLTATTSSSLRSAFIPKKATVVRLFRVLGNNDFPGQIAHDTFVSLDGQRGQSEQPIKY